MPGKVGRPKGCVVGNDVYAKRYFRALSRAERGFGLPPINYVPTMKNARQHTTRGGVRLVAPDSDEGEIIQQREIARKITKVAVDQVIDIGGDHDTILPPLGEFAPNKGTIFEGVKFLTDSPNEKVLNEDDLQAALYMARDGASRHDCADVIGIATTTLDRLEKRNPLWAAAFRRAKVLGKLALVRRIREGDNHWQSAAWMLERLHKSEYGLKAGDEEETKVIRVRQINKNAGLPGGSGGGNGSGNGNLLSEAVGHDPELETDMKLLEAAKAGQTNLNNGVDTLIDVDGTPLVPKSKKVSSRARKTA